jgi:hypothetical protein
MARHTVLYVVLAASLASATGCYAKATSKSGQQSSGSAQQLRTCVDRWNQANMVGWGPAFVRASVRRLDAKELGAVGLRDPARRRCVISFAFESRADPQTGCSGRACVPGKPGWCLDRSGTFSCAINPLGAAARVAALPAHRRVGGALDANRPPSTRAEVRGQRTRPLLHGVREDTREARIGLPPALQGRLRAPRRPKRHAPL